MRGWLSWLYITLDLGDYGWGLAYSSADSIDQVHKAEAHDSHLSICLSGLSMFNFYMLLP